MTEREQLPWQAWRRCLHRAVRDQQAETLLYGEVQGDLRLRLGLVDYLGYSRGLPCSADQLLITQGAQQGLDLLARVRWLPGIAWQWKSRATRLPGQCSRRLGQQ